ncbi:hypothetical protein P3S67_023012 [Capsicum chacoense]
MGEAIDIAGVAVKKEVLADIVDVQDIAHSHALALTRIHLRVLNLVHALFLVSLPDLVHLDMTGCINLIKMN